MKFCHLLEDALKGLTQVVAFLVGLALVVVALPLVLVGLLGIGLGGIGIMLLGYAFDTWM